MLQRRPLGRTGLRVSVLGLGAWALGGEGSTPHYGLVTEKEALSVLQGYADAGGNLIDTARLYNDSERIIGEFIRQRGSRNDLLIATKTAYGEQEDTVVRIREDLETSLRLLRTDCVDILQLHQPPVESDVIWLALNEMEKLKREGKIRAIGVSIKGVDVTEQTEQLCRQYIATGKIDAIQLVYSVLRQRHARVIEEASASGIGIIVRTALESGLLTGKHAPGYKFGRHDQRLRYKPENLEFILRATQNLQRFAVRPPYESLAQVALRFAIEPTGVSTVIAGAHSLESIKQNMKAMELPPLDEQLVHRLRIEFGGVTERANYS